MERLISIGKVVRTWGLRGDVAIKLFSGRVGHLMKFHKLMAGEEADSIRTICLERERFRRRQIIAKFSGIDSKEEAEKIIGWHVFVRVSELGPLAEDEYYIDDLVGMRVVLESGKAIGRVIAIDETRGTDLLVVQKGAKEFLIPFARSICVRVEIENRIIVVRPPAGLLDLNEISCNNNLP
ncbi:MAG: ribosome maturation factor RimM [Acidobacteriota bacterium]